MQAAAVASLLWQKGYAHGDLSVRNVMWDGEFVKLIDLQTLHKPKVCLTLICHVYVATFAVS